MRISLSRGSISHADFLPGEHFSCGFPSGGAFCMRQVRGGEAFIVAKAIVPSSRSSPPGHAAVLRCGMCYFADGAMDSTVLDIAGCADINNGYAFSSGSLQSASLLASPDTSKSSPTAYCLLLFATLQRTYLIQLNITLISGNRNLISGNRPAMRAAFLSALIHRLSLTASTPWSTSPSQ